MNGYRYYDYKNKKGTIVIQKMTETNAKPVGQR